MSETLHISNKRPTKWGGLLGMGEYLVTSMVLTFRILCVGFDSIFKPNHNTQSDSEPFLLSSKSQTIINREAARVADMLWKFFYAIFNWIEWSSDVASFPKKLD